MPVRASAVLARVIQKRMADDKKPSGQESKEAPAASGQLAE